jgi:hypothetical protein
MEIETRVQLGELIECAQLAAVLHFPPRPHKLHGSMYVCIQCVRVISTPFVVFSSVTCVRASVACSVLRRILGYTDDQQTPQYSVVASHDTWRSTTLAIEFCMIMTWVCSKVLRGVCLSYMTVYALSKSVHKRNLTSICSRMSSSCILVWHHAYIGHKYA